MLIDRFQKKVLEAGVDEAGRGCLAGPVYAAAVILPDGFYHEGLNDSKKLTEKQRDTLRIIIEHEAIAWAVASAGQDEIDAINILNATFLAMHRAISTLHVSPGYLLIDGNRFKPYRDIEHKCIVRGDSLYASIAAASVLAKTHRDEFMKGASAEFPCYNWDQNKGYPTLNHREAILKYGFSPYHRRSFSVQIKLF